MRAVARGLFRSILVFAVFGVLAASHAGAEPSTSLWEFGAGLGLIHYEHYPASNHFTDLLLPFPTFQYRGQILRADDREGTRAYLFRASDTTLEVAGALLPALKSSDDENRRGMADLPWMGQLGPQLVHRFNPAWEIRFAIFENVGTTDLKTVRAAGQVGEVKLIHRWESPFAEILGMEAGTEFGEVALQAQAATKEFLATYFEVPAENATPDRPAYEAKAGFISAELSLFERFRTGRATIYFGAALTDYGLSVNRASPLHRSNRNVTGLVGLTYTLGESKRSSVPEEQTEGLINRIQEKRRGETH